MPEAGPESAPARPRRRPGRRTEIVRRTADLLLERGFEITSLVDVTAACGISKAGLYDHFRGKQGLLAAIIGYAQDIHEHEVRNGPHGRLRCQCGK